MKNPLSIKELEFVVKYLLTKKPPGWNGFNDEFCQIFKEKNELRLFIPNTKINLKQITDLNIKTKMIKLPEENTGGHVFDFEIGKEFLDRMQKA